MRLNWSRVLRQLAEIRWLMGRPGEQTATTLRWTGTAGVLATSTEHDSVTGTHVTMRGGAEIALGQQLSALAERYAREYANSSLPRVRDIQVLYPAVTAFRQARDWLEAQFRQPLPAGPVEAQTSVDQASRLSELAVQVNHRLRLARRLTVVVGDRFGFDVDEYEVSLTATQIGRTDDEIRQVIVLEVGRQLGQAGDGRMFAARSQPPSPDEEVTDDAVLAWVRASVNDVLALRYQAPAQVVRGDARESAYDVDRSHFVLSGEDTPPRGPLSALEYYDVIQNWAADIVDRSLPARPVEAPTSVDQTSRLINGCRAPRRDVPVRTDKRCSAARTG